MMSDAGTGEILKLKRPCSITDAVAVTVIVPYIEFGCGSHMYVVTPGMVKVCEN